MIIKLISLKDANAYVIEHHRHHDKVQGHKFSISVWDDDRLCGVAIVGHPQSRRIDNDNVLEVLRLCTDGTYNACSILYARCARIGKDMGYKKIITYILESESGASLKASGWHLEADNLKGREWNTPSRQRVLIEQQMSIFGDNKPKYSTENKKRYAKILEGSDEK